MSTRKYKFTSDTRNHKTRAKRIEDAQALRESRITEAQKLLVLHTLNELLPIISKNTLEEIQNSSPSNKDRIRVRTAMAYYGHHALDLTLEELSYGLNIALEKIRSNVKTRPVNGKIIHYLQQLEEYY